MWGQFYLNLLSTCPSVMKRAQCRHCCIFLSLAASTLHAVAIHHQSQLTASLFLLSSHLFTLTALRRLHRAPQTLLMGHAFALFEVVCVGQGVWHHLYPFALGVPLWSPFAWANICLFIRYV